MSGSSALRLLRPSWIFRRGLATVQEAVVAPAIERTSEDVVAEPVNPRHGRVPRRLPKQPDPEKAQRVFLPNIDMVLVRNAVKPGTPYDPYTATFRCTTKLSKPDIYAYLSQIYKLEMTSLRTMIYMGEVKRERGSGKRYRPQGYKKVVVGLKDPFWYPDEPSHDWIEENFDR
jgi:ribosomal protein L23